MVEKCRYYNDHQTASCLMIDDLVPAAVTIDGKVDPSNDWGYLKDGAGSLYNYFREEILSKYPQIRGTIFLPLESHLYIPKNTGYTVYTSDIDHGFIEFLKSIEQVFDIEFHGVKHTFFKNGQLVFEFENLSENDTGLLTIKLDEFLRKGLQFTGAKFPGYKYNNTAINFLKNRGYSWVALDAQMINRRHIGNQIATLENFNLINIPTNVSGNLFQPMPMNTKIKNRVKRFLAPKNNVSPERYLTYLYKNQLPITIQEHFQNQTTSGKRQTPNIYDDIKSLHRIYGFLKPLDIWYTSCFQMAQYFDAYTNTRLIVDKGQFELVYLGKTNTSGLSIITSVSSIQNIETEAVFSGKFAKGKFVFNNVQPGKYTCL